MSAQYSLSFSSVFGLYQWAKHLSLRLLTGPFDLAFLSISCFISLVVIKVQFTLKSKIHVCIWVWVVLEILTIDINGNGCRPVVLLSLVNLRPATVEDVVCRFWQQTFAFTTTTDHSEEKVGPEMSVGQKCETQSQKTEIYHKYLASFTSRAVVRCTQTKTKNDVQHQREFQMKLLMFSTCLRTLSGPFKADPGMILWIQSTMMRIRGATTTCAEQSPLSIPSCTRIPNLTVPVHSISQISASNSAVI